MRTGTALVVLPLILLLGAAAPTEIDPTCRLERAAPADVVPYLQRMADCNHWLGEEPYDAERARDINAAVAELKCERLPRDEARLRKRYATSPKVLAMIGEGESLLGWTGCRTAD